MGTREFNFIDVLIANWRLRKVYGYATKGDTVLDFGCGYQAFLLRRISPIIKKGIGVDYDVKNGYVSNNVVLKKLRFSSKLPFKSSSFDKIFMLAVIEHFSPYTAKRLISETDRILKKGGYLVLTTPAPRSQILLEFLAFRTKLISEEEIADHKKYYSRHDLEDLAGKTRLKLVSFDTFQFGFNSFAVLRKL